MISMDLRPFLATALEAASLASNIHAHYRQVGFFQSTKSTPTDVVTQADQEAEAAIRHLIEQRHPGHSVLGEEGGEVGSSPFRWVVDPLDGTVNYAHGFPFYAVSIGLELEGDILVGVVQNTAFHELFWAIKGGGAFHNGKPIRVSQQPKLLGSLVATGFPYNVAQDRENLTYLERVLYKGITVRRPGAAALDLAYVACGRLEGFWEVKLSPWDVAAGWLLVQEAGGQLTGIRGEPYALGNRYLVASNGTIHQELLETLHND